MKESELLSFSIDALKYSGLVWFRVPVGGVAHSIGSKIIYKKSPLKGFSDLAIITKSGVLSTLELKSDKGKLSEDQKDWIKRLAETNCNTCVAKTREDVLLYIHRLGGSISPAHLIFVPGLNLI